MTEAAEFTHGMKAGDKLTVIDERQTAFKEPVPFKKGETVTVKSVWRDGCLELVEYPAGSGSPAAAYHPNRFATGDQP